MAHVAEASVRACLLPDDAIAARASIVAALADWVERRSKLVVPSAMMLLAMVALGPVVPAFGVAASPGAYDATATRTEVCSPGYARSHRHVPRVLRNRIYNTYGLPRGERRGMTLDHYIPLELGGTNAVANLVPEPRAEAARKDRDENRLHTAVCAGRLTLPAARAEILRLWRR